MLTLTTDAENGGRWTSLRSPSREWLWHRPAPEREKVAPGDAFVDAGGLEECVPTVRGLPDHGDVWSRAWARTGDTEHVQGDSFTLARTISTTADGVRADYLLTAPAGFRFVWAAHALLDLSARATLHMTDGAPTRLFPRPHRSSPSPGPPAPPGSPARGPHPTECR
nr:hypothetical protein [Streptomyces chartreusis]